MISVDLYREVLPDWTRLRMLEQSELEAAAELLVAIAQLAAPGDDSPSHKDIRETWLELLAGFDQTSRAALGAHIDTSNERVRSLFNHPRAFGVLLASACSRLRSPITQFHAMCLFVVSVFMTGPDERQIELCYRIGKKFGMDEERVEELFGRMWSAYQSARADRNGAPISPDYVDGTHWQRDAQTYRRTNPFEKSAR